MIYTLAGIYAAIMGEPAYLLFTLGTAAVVWFLCRNLPKV